MTKSVGDETVSQVRDSLLDDVSDTNMSVSKDGRNVYTPDEEATKMVYGNSNILYNIGVLILGVLFIPVLSIGGVAALSAVLIFIFQGHPIISAFLLIFLLITFFATQVFLGYVETCYLRPLRWWTPLLAAISPIILIGIPLFSVIRLIR